MRIALLIFFFHFSCNNNFNQNVYPNLLCNIQVINMFPRHSANDLNFACGIPALVDKRKSQSNVINGGE